MVDTFQGLGAQMWPISPTASKADWGSASIFRFKAVSFKEMAREDFEVNLVKLFFSSSPSLSQLFFDFTYFYPSLIYQFFSLSASYPYSISFSACESG